jgi:hypothetical protein
MLYGVILYGLILYGVILRSVFERPARRISDYQARADEAIVKKLPFGID